jgi:type IV pilus assembly protein PilM
MAILDSISSLWKDPPPAVAFELSEAGLASARVTAKTELGFHPLKPGTLSVSPLRDNIIVPDDLAMAVREVSAPQVKTKRRDAALIIPDYCTRIAVLDFDDFPSDFKEQLSLVRFRMKKSVPYDVESAAVSFWPQNAGEKKFDVVVVVSPIEIVARYEAPFRNAGLNPGLVMPSCLAAMHLLEAGPLTITAKLTGHVLTVLVTEKGRLRLVRCLELASVTVDDVAADLFPTFVFVEDNMGAKAEKLLLCGFGPLAEEARRQFTADLRIDVDLVRSPLGVPGEHDAGLLGYLRSVALNN